MKIIFFREKDYQYFKKHEEIMRRGISNIHVHNLKKNKYKEIIANISKIDNGKLLKRIITCFK